MSMTIQCEDCGSRYTVDDRSAGKRVKCRKCGNVFTVPEAVALGGPGISEAYDVDGVPDADHAPAEPPPPITPVPAYPRPTSAAAHGSETSLLRSWKLWVPVGAVVVAAGVAAAVFLAGGPRGNRDTALRTPANPAGVNAPPKAATGTRTPVGDADTQPDNSEPEGASTTRRATTARSGNGSALFDIDPDDNPGANPRSSGNSELLAANRNPESGVGPTVPSKRVGPIKPKAGSTKPPPKTGPTQPSTPVPSVAPGSGPVNPSPTPRRWDAKVDQSQNPPYRPGAVAKAPVVSLSIALGDGDLVYPNRTSHFAATVKPVPRGYQYDQYNLSTGVRTGEAKIVDYLSEAVLSPDGVLLAGITPGRANRVTVLSFAKGGVLRSLQIAEDMGNMLPLGFIDNKRLLTTVQGDKLLQVWDIHSGEQGDVLHELKLDRDLGPPGTFSQSPGGEFLATVFGDRLIVFDLTDGEITGDVELPLYKDVSFNQFVGISYSPDGRHLAALFDGTSKPARVVTWDAAKGSVTDDILLADDPDDRVGRCPQVIHPIEWLPGGRGWLLYGDTIVDLKGSLIARRSADSKPKRGGLDLRWRMLDDTRALVAAEQGGKILLTSVVVPAAAEQKAEK